MQYLLWIIIIENHKIEELYTTYLNVITKSQFCYYKKNPEQRVPDK